MKEIQALLIYSNLHYLILNNILYYYYISIYWIVYSILPMYV